MFRAYNTLSNWRGNLVKTVDEAIKEAEANSLANGQNHIHYDHGYEIAQVLKTTLASVRKLNWEDKK